MSKKSTPNDSFCEVGKIDGPESIARMSDALATAYAATGWWWGLIGIPVARNVASTIKKLASDPNAKGRGGVSTGGIRVDNRDGTIFVLADNELYGKLGTKFLVKP